MDERIISLSILIGNGQTTAVHVGQNIEGRRVHQILDIPNGFSAEDIDGRPVMQIINCPTLVMYEVNKDE